MLLETLFIDSESEGWMSAAFAYQHANLPQQLLDYASLIDGRIHYRWVNDRIVHPLPIRETQMWHAIQHAMYDVANVLIHLERGVGEWCAGCRYGYNGHQSGLDRGARILGLR